VAPLSEMRASRGHARPALRDVLASVGNLAGWRSGLQTAADAGSESVVGVRSEHARESGRHRDDEPQAGGRHTAMG